MRNPAELPVVTRSRRRGNSSFVGIRQRSDGKSEFCLPLGFDDFDEYNKAAIKDLFFDLFKTFRIFQRGLDFRRDHQLKDQQDGILSKSSGLSFIDKDGEQVTLYSKIPALEAVLDGYDELRIFRLISQPRTTEEVDYSRIDRYLHKAVYLPEQGHLAYIDEMVLPRPVLTYTVADLVRMYCFIYVEVKGALDELASLAPEIRAQAQIFKEQHLRSDSALFESETHARTIHLLKETLNQIDRQTSYKDGDYWHFFDAVETFLYGNTAPDTDGISWGISKFSVVWEDLCNTYVFTKRRQGVIYADSARYGKTYVAGHRVFLEEKDDFTDADGKPPFYIQHGDTRRYMRPDLVRRREPAFTEEKFDEAIQMKYLGERVGRCSVKLQEESGKPLFDDINHRLSSTGIVEHRGKKKCVYKAVARSRFKSIKTEVLNDWSQSNNDKSYRVVDYKYVPAYIYKKDSGLNSKARDDLRKQLAYEYAIQLSVSGATTNSQLCVPHYYARWPDGIGDEVDSALLHRSLRDQGIEVLLVNFEEVLQTYLHTHRLQASSKSINGRAN